MIGLELLKRFALPVAITLAVCAAGYMVLRDFWEGGRAEANAEWQARWDAHLAEDALATSKAQAEQLAIQASREQTINKVTQDAQRTIDQAQADAAAADARSISVQQRADAIATDLASSQASLGACTTAASQAAARHARVLADVLKRADTRAGILAGAADQARARGLACEAAYDGLEQSR